MKKLFPNYEVLWLTLNTLLMVSSNFILLKILTISVSVEVYGEIAFAVSIAAFFSMLFFGPFGQGVQRFFPAGKSDEEKKKFLLVNARLIIYFILFVILVVSVCIPFILRVGNNYFILLVSAIALSMFSGVNVVLAAYFNARRLRKKVMLINSGELIVKLVIVFILVKYTSVIAEQVISVYAFSAMLIAILACETIVKEFGNGAAVGKVVGPRLRHFVQKDPQLTYTAKFMLMAIFASFSLYFDRWILGLGSSFKELGVYAVLFQMSSTPFILVTGLLSQYYAPVLFQQNKSGPAANKLLLRITLRAVAAYLCILIVLYFLGEQLLLLVSTNDYSVYHLYLPILGLGHVLVGIVQILFLKAQNDFAPLVILPAWIGRTIVVAIFGYPVISTFGINGIIWLYLFAALIYFVIALYRITTMGNQQLTAS